MAEKLRAVRLYREAGFSQAQVCEELKIRHSSLEHWLKACRLAGAAGLQSKLGGRRQAKLPAPITEKIGELKRQNPTFGIKGSSQGLRRGFFLPASPETVRPRLPAAELMSEPTPAKRRNLVRPRFFERATPNQMWQTDSFTFRRGGRPACLMACMDDGSRCIVGADLFRSPTAAAVMEV